MNKELFPTIEGVHMAIFCEGELFLLRGELQHYSFDEVDEFTMQSPEYSKDIQEVTFCRYRSGTVTISKEDGDWVAEIVEGNSN